MSGASGAKALISGAATSQLGRRVARSPFQLTLDAVLGAIEDAGLKPSDIDGLVTNPGQAALLNPGFNGPDLYEIQDALGLELNWHLGACQGPAQFMSVIPAAAAVRTGLCKHVVAFRTTSEASAQGPGRRRGLDDHLKEADGVLAWLLASGSVSPTNWAAFFAQRHMHQYGTTKEQLGWIALTARKHAALNPDAIFQQPLTMEDYLNSRMISSPLSLYDCDIPMDGSLAVVISAPETKADLRHWAEIEAVGSAMWHRPYWELWHDLTTSTAHDAAAQMWGQTDLKWQDVDVAEIYDAFSFFSLNWLEALGVCGPGESGPFVEGGNRISLGGDLPINTWGGQLSGGRLHGWGYLVEALRQLWGVAGQRQVDSAQVAVVGVGGGAAASSLLLTAGR